MNICSIHVLVRLEKWEKKNVSYSNGALIKTTWRILNVEHSSQLFCADLSLFAFQVEPHP